MKDGDDEDQIKITAVRVVQQALTLHYINA